MENISTILQATCRTPSQKREAEFSSPTLSDAPWNRSYRSYCVVVTVVELLICKEKTVPDKDGDGSQDEGDKQLDVNVVPGAVQLPVEYIRSALEAFLHPLTCKQT